MEIVRMKFGSHLYGTSTPDSDHDYKGVALPARDDVLLGRIPHHIENSSTGDAYSKNTSTDVDTEIICLHRFIKDALEGKPYTMDMIHCPKQFIIHSDPIWEFIQKHKSKLYNKSIHVSIDYVIKQAAKYGIKGSRLDVIKECMDVCMWGGDRKLKAVWTNLPVGAHSRHIEIEHDGVMYMQYEICGKTLQDSMQCIYAYRILSKYYDNYGERARKAANNEGVDWKAVSHAFRVAYQMQELFIFNRITFPRPEAKLLLDIKTGKYKYNDIIPVLETLVDEVKVLCDKSNFPENPDVKFWEDFVCRTTMERVLQSKEA